MFYDDDDDEKPFLKLRKHHQKLADDLGMSEEEYLNYQKKIDNIEAKRQEDEFKPVELHLDQFISLGDNIDNLGYSKHFLSKEDAEFLYKKMVEWENNNSYMVSFDEAEYDEASQKEYINAFMASGIRYHFQEIGITIYIAFEFVQMDYHNYDSHLEYGYHMYYYNHRNGEFRDARSEELVVINFPIK